MVPDIVQTMQTRDLLMNGLSRGRDNSEGRSDDNTSNTHADHMADAEEGIM